VRAAAVLWLPRRISELKEWFEREKDEMRN
jgi:hypothetical protein